MDTTTAAAPTVGLSAREAAERLAAEGPNAVSAPAPRRLSARVGRQLADPLVALLIVAAVVTGARRPAGHRGDRPRRHRQQRSPIWDLIMKYEVALPLHPEYRTMPMVWYIPRCPRSSTSCATPDTTART